MVSSISIEIYGTVEFGHLHDLTEVCVETDDKLVF